ncbi:hypothetical protein P8452_52186 [Trifolium repens]|nr:hypothetical protein P8452_52186 [Trifolium repens]
MTDAEKSVWLKKVAEDPSKVSFAENAITSSCVKPVVKSNEPPVVLLHGSLIILAPPLAAHFSIFYIHGFPQKPSITTPFQLTHKP